MLRTAGAFWFYYDKSQGPSFGWTFPLRMAAYMLCIDYFFVSPRLFPYRLDLEMLILLFIYSTATTDHATSVSTLQPLL